VLGYSKLIHDDMTKANLGLEAAMFFTNELKRVNEKVKAKLTLDKEIKTPAAEGAMATGESQVITGATDHFAQVFRKTEEVAKFNNIVIQQGEKLLSIINDLLDLSQIEAGVMKFNKETVSTRLLIFSVITTLSSVAKSKGIILETNINSYRENDLFFVSDKKRLEQVLQNIVENAIKYSERGSVSLSIIQEDNILVFTVDDEGIGMPEEEREAIFEPFRQLDGSATRKIGGVGLGLALVRKLVDSMGGEITVTSKVGAGSSFTVRFPFEEPKKYTQTKNNNDLEVTLVKGKRILVVEDDKNMQFLIKENLKGNEISQALNGREGLELLNSEPKYDLIFLDLHMPEMGGEEMVENLPDGYQVPIIVLSADAIKEQEVQIKEVAKRKKLKLEYMFKPVSMRDLSIAFGKVGVV